MDQQRLTLLSNGADKVANTFVKNNVFSLIDDQTDYL